MTKVKLEYLILIVGMVCLFSSALSVSPACEYHVLQEYQRTNQDPATATMDAVIVPGDDVGIGPVLYVLVSIGLTVFVAFLAFAIWLVMKRRISFCVLLGIGYFALGLGLHAILWTCS